MNIKQIFSTTALLLVVFSTLIFTACEENNMTTNDLAHSVESFNDVNNMPNTAQQKVLAISNSSAKKPASAIITVQTENTEMMHKIQSADFSINPVFELAEIENTENTQNSLINKSSKKAIPVSKHTVEIEISKVDIPLDALGYQIKLNTKIFSKNTTMVLKDTEGNRRSATVENQTEMGFGISNSYYRCDFSAPLDEDDYVENGILEPLYPNQSHAFEWTPANVFLNQVEIIFEDTIPGNLLITFSIPGSCLQTEGCNPDQTITKCESSDLVLENVELVNTQPQSCNAESESCNALATHKIIPNFTVQNMSKFASTGLHKNIHDLTSTYLKHQDELTNLFTNDKEVQLAVHQFLNKHKVAIVNSFSSKHYTLKRKQIKDATQLMELIKARTNDTHLKQTFKQVQQELKQFEGKTLPQALKQFDLNAQ